MSDEGEVRSIPRDVPHSRKSPHPRLKAQFAGNQYGHLCVSLTGDDMKSKHRYVHRLVAVAFIPNPEGHPYVLHGSAGHLDNSVSNLRWGTAAQNTADSQEFGNWKRQPQRTHCVHGHAFTPENTYISPSRGERACKECMRTRSRERARALRKAGVRRRPLVVIHPRACAECRSEFTPRRRSDAVFCSAACKSKAHRKKGDA